MAALRGHSWERRGNGRRGRRHEAVGFSSLRSVAVDHIKVVKDSVESLNAWHRGPRILGHFDGRSEIRFDLHWSPRHIVLPHNAFGVVRLCHVVNGLLLEVWIHFAAVDLGQIYQLVDDTVYHVLDPDFVHQSTVLCCFKQDTCGVKSNWTADAISIAPTWFRICIELTQLSVRIVLA